MSDVTRILSAIEQGDSHAQSLAGLYGWLGRPDEAIALRHRILDIRKATLGPDHPETLTCMGNLARTFQGVDKSVWLLEQVLEKQRAICGPTHPDTLGTMHHLAMAYGHQGRIAESITLHEKVLEQLRSATDPDDKISCTKQPW